MMRGHRTREKLLPSSQGSRPIFMIGAERSGTTLVMALLGAHPNIAVPEVAWYYPRFRPYIHTYGDLSQESNFRTLVDEMIFGLKTPLWDLPVNPATIVSELVDSADERSFRGAYSAILRRYADHHGKPRWGEKTPHNLFFIGEILEDYPDAQFIFITRDGRDASADYLESAFGPTNIFVAGEFWAFIQQYVQPWRERLSASQWFDLSYEDLVRQPETVLRRVTEFLGEPYDPRMLEFHTGLIAQRRGATRDHAPLGKPISDRYVGIYKNLLSARDQGIFAAVAGDELKASGYAVDVAPIVISEAEADRQREVDSRTRAALLEAPDGHIVYESYNDWLVDRREERRRQGVWTEPATPPFPIGHRFEENITGYRAWRKWKQHFAIKRQYIATGVVL
jgi:hypothetical protein